MNTFSKSVTPIVIESRTAWKDRRSISSPGKPTVGEINSNMLGQDTLRTPKNHLKPFSPWWYRTTFQDLSIDICAGASDWRNARISLHKLTTKLTFCLLVSLRVMGLGRRQWLPTGAIAVDSRLAMANTLFFFNKKSEAVVENFYLLNY